MGKVDSKPKFTDSHYGFDYKLTEEDIERGFVKLDPYFINRVWRLNEKDDTGILFHCLKLLCRFGVKNSKERELKALLAQTKRWMELEGVDINEK